VFYEVISKEIKETACAFTTVPCRASGMNLEASTEKLIDYLLAL
jgi:hypothetical protein